MSDMHDDVPIFTLGAVTMAQLKDIGGVSGPFRGLTFNQFNYPDFRSMDSALFEYRLPFEDCDAAATQISKRRFVVPGALLAMTNTPARLAFIDSIAQLYVAAVADAISADYRRTLFGVNDVTNEHMANHRQAAEKLLARFDQALHLLQDEAAIHLAKGTGSTKEGSLVLSLIHALNQANSTLLTPSLLFNYGQLLTLNMRVEFTPLQWLGALETALLDALGQGHVKPPAYLVRTGEPVGGYVLSIAQNWAPSNFTACVG